MKHRKNCTLLILVFTLIASVAVLGQTNPNHVHVRGYYRKNGTYVQPHYMTAPNSTNRDNFSTRGNTNPYTGRPGYVRPDNKPAPSTSYSKKQSINSLDNRYEEKRVGLYPDGSVYARMKSNGQLWRKPNQFDKIRAIAKHSYVEVLDYEDGFWKVISNGTIGYIFDITIETNEAMLPIKRSAETKYLTKSSISRQNRSPNLRQSIVHSTVSHEEIRYASSSSVQPGNCTMDDRKYLIDHRFVVQNSYLVNQPSVQGKPVLKVNFGDKVNVICSKEKWLEVVYQNRTGWIEERLLRK